MKWDYCGALYFMSLSFLLKLLTEHPLNPNSNRLKMADIFFENFGAPKIFFQ
jgi:hypothetical protein